MENEEFFTFREYMAKDDNLLTASMQDYLEMIFRLAVHSGYTRTHDLAAALNVQPPSTTKMMKRLAEVGLVNYEKYGVITLSEKGKEIGKALLERHLIIEEFLQLLGVTENVLQETEKIEHTISDHTLQCIDNFVAFLKNRPKIMIDFKGFQREA
ncbi:MAG TPA: iron dependent repressor, metal binding and dimerization domain protein [Spirochaetia bacterium]|nr:iron dependent repressor, metal binding and dimerization domain protein [Spirochaetia bacterium]